jgi:glycosyltransferase involved in cell wall biosynthesis
MRTSDYLRDLSLILVSPNVSEEMGGEAIKALQIYLEFERTGAKVHQITHERVKGELDRKFPKMNVSYVKDGRVQKALYRLGLLTPSLSAASGAVIALIFQWRAAQLVKALIEDKPNSIVHFTSPISPVLPYFAMGTATVIIGPLNGNIYYPPAFRHREPITDYARRWLHPHVQRLQRFVLPGKVRADALLVAGGERTLKSLRMGGCREAQFVASLDSGVSDEFHQRPRIRHSGQSYRFVHIGRLVKFKGTDALIRSLLQTRTPIELDIIGRGPELGALKRLTEALGLNNRVKFLDWITDHSLIAETFGGYRALVLPSLAEANGIVVQEAMALGLPVIALNWGGPALLVTPKTGILVEPLTEEYVLTELAKAMDRLAQDGEMAERMSIAGRHLANEQGFLWSALIRKWAELYRVLSQRRNTSWQQSRLARTQS